MVDLATLKARSAPEKRLRAERALLMLATEERVSATEAVRSRRLEEAR